MTTTMTNCDFQEETNAASGSFSAAGEAPPIENEPVSILLMLLYVSLILY